MRRIADEESFFWLRPIMKPKSKFQYMLSCVIAHPGDYDTIERRFWISPYLPWRVKAFYAAIRYGILVNTERNACSVPVDLLGKFAGVAGSGHAIRALLRFCRTCGFMEFQGEFEDTIILIVKDLGAIDKMLLAPDSMLKFVDQGARADGQGHIDAEFMEGLWSIFTGRCRPVDKETYRRKEQEFRLQLARAGRILAAQHDNDSDTGDDDDGGSVLTGAKAP